MAKMTAKRQRFVEEYLIDLNATRAAIRAGYSIKTARVQGNRMLTNVDIQEAVQARREALKKKTGLTQERVLDEYRKLAFFDVRKMFDEDGEPLGVKELDDDTAACIVGLDVLEERDDEGILTGYVKKYKIADKKGALDSAARHLGLFNDKLKVDIQLPTVISGGDALED